MSSYPSTLPNPGRASHTPKPRNFATDLEGPASYLNRERDLTRTVDLEFFFTAEQAAEFYLWWRDSLLCGGRWFNCTWPSLTPGSLVAQFITEPSFEHIYNGAHKVTLQAQVRGKSNAVSTWEDPYFENVSFLLHADGTIEDSSSYAHTCTPQNGIGLTTSNPKFGSGCVLSSGSGGGQIAVTHSTALDMGSGDFTAEAWVAITTTSGLSRGVMGKGSNMYAVTMGFYLFVETSGVRARISNGTSYLTLTSPTVFPAPGTYVHVALTREGNNFHLQAGGVTHHTGTLAGALGVNTSPLYVGGNPSENGVIGLIDEVRLTKGLARYSGEGTYDVPTRAFADR